MNNKTMNKELEFKKNSMLIEAILTSFGITVRVAKVNDYRDCAKYFLELAIGTPIQDLLKLDRDIAISLASPTGSIEMQAPIPNSALIEIIVPKHDKYNKQKPVELLHSYKMDFERTLFKPADGWRGKTSNIFYVFGSSLIKLSAKINRK